MKKKHRFGEGDYRVDTDETLHQGFFRMSKVTLSHKLFGGGWSKPLQRELFNRGEAVGVLLYDPINHLVGIVEQFRVGALKEQDGPWQYELVAGMMKPGESSVDVAVRELQEEAGVKTYALIPICNYLVSGGGTDEKMHLLCGLADLGKGGGIFGLEEESEDILFQVWPYKEAVQALNDGLLNNAATTIAMLWLQLNYQQLQTTAQNEVAQ